MKKLKNTASAQLWGPWGDGGAWWWPEGPSMPPGSLKAATKATFSTSSREGGPAWEISTPRGTAPGRSWWWWTWVGSSCSEKKMLPLWQFWLRAGHFRYFGIFSNNKKIICIFYEDSKLFLHQSYLQKPTPSQISLIKNAKNHFYLVKKLKNTASAQLRRFKGRKRVLVRDCGDQETDECRQEEEFANTGAVSRSHL